MKKQPYTQLEQLPLTLNAEDISTVLRISRAQTYHLLKSDGFPTLRVGRRMLVPKHSFLAWVDKQTEDAA